MKGMFRGFIAATVLAAAGITVQGSSHREALAVLNEPCADNTDTFAWVSDKTHDKLYLIMDFNPLHEPGQGNQGLRACNGYRYEFHIAKGASLNDKVVYRVEFKNSLRPEDAPSAADPLGGGNELLWQLTGGTENMKVTRITAGDDRHRDDGFDDESRGGDRDKVVVLGRDLPVLPNNHGPQTDRLVYGLGPFQGYDSADPTSREVGLYDQPFVDSYIHTLANGGRIIAGQFDDPYQLDEKGIFDLVNLNRNDLGWHSRRAPASGHGRVHRLQPVLDRARGSDRGRVSARHSPQRHAEGQLDRQSASGCGQASAGRKPRPSIRAISSPASRAPDRGCRLVAMRCRSSMPASSERSVRRSICARARTHDVTNFGADILFPVLVRDAEALGIYAALGVAQSTVDTVLKGPRLDIINAINLGRPIPVKDGFTGDVITLDAAIDSSFPNGRRMGGGPTPNANQVNVNSVLISLIVAGDPAAGLAKGVEVNDKNYLDRFPFLAPAHQGLLQGHGGINVPTVPNIPVLQ